MIPFPEMLHQVTQGTHRFTFSVDPEHFVFQGHFPEDPILPGLVQVDWALRLAVDAFGPTGPFLGLEHLKFCDLIRPGEAITLELSLDPSRCELAFEYRGGSTRKSSGIAHFGSLP